MWADRSRSRTRPAFFIKSSHVKHGISNSQKDPDPPAVALAEQREGVATQRLHPQPAVAEGAGRQQLNRVGEALRRFADDVEQNPGRHAAHGDVDHFGADQHSRRRVTVERFDQLQKFIEGIAPAAAVPAPRARGDKRFFSGLVQW